MGGGYFGRAVPLLKGGIMQGKFQIEDPKKIVATLTLTTSIKEWCELRDQLQHKWPSSDLVYLIDDVLSKAQKIFWADVKED
jgi:hypothetical protein